MNKRDAINHIRQFGGRLDRFRKSVGGSGDGGRNAPKRAKSSPKPVNRKTNVFNEQVRYAFHGALQDLKSKPFATFLTVMVIAISLTLPSVCYMVYKNVNQAATQYYPSPQITVYLQKTLDDDAAAGVVAQLQAEQGVEKVNYLSREDALGEFRNWSGFGGALDMLEENPLPAVAVVIPKLDFQGTESLNTLRDRITQINGIDEVRMDDSWFARLAALTGLVGRVSAMIGVLMVAAVFLVIGNSVRLSIFARRDSINVQKLIGATDGFILRPFLYGGALLGFSGALLSLILSEILVLRLSSAVAEVAQVFGTKFDINGLSFDECLLLLLVCSMIGWVISSTGCSSSAGGTTITASSAASAASACASSSSSVISSLAASSSAASTISTVSASACHSSGETSSALTSSGNGSSSRSIATGSGVSSTTGSGCATTSASGCAFSLSATCSVTSTTSAAKVSASASVCACGCSSTACSEAFTGSCA